MSNDLISRSHFDDRVRLAAGPDADLEYSADFLEGIKVVLYMLSTEPAVPHEMSAREYLNARWLMCLMYDNCKGCPFCESWEDFSEKPILCYSHERMDSDGAVAVVEKWAREHPKERSEE